MHQKHHHLIIATYALLALAAPLIWAQGAHAQTACPAGYTCTPIQQVSNCPTGFVCTVNTGTSGNVGSVNNPFTNGYYWGGNTYNPYTNTSTAIPGNTQIPLSATCTGTPSNTGTYSVMWIAQTMGGQAPYQYSWNLYNQYTSFGTDGTTSSRSFTTNYGLTGNKSAAVRVTDSRGISTTASCSSVIPDTTTGSATNPQPIINSITPAGGNAQTRVTITGTNLSGANAVEFRRTDGLFVGSLVPSSSTANSVFFTISDIFAGNITPGLYLVSVVNPACGAGCSSNRLNFTFFASNTGTAGSASVDLKVNGVDSVGVYNNATVRVSWSALNASYCQASGSTLNLVGGGMWGYQGRLATVGSADVIAYTGGTLPSDVRLGIQCYRADGTSVTDTAIISINPSNTTTVTPTATPIMRAISPESAVPPLIATVTGANLAGVTSVNFINSFGNYAGSATTNNAIANRFYFMVPPGLPAGTYQIAAVAGDCKTGCDSNRVQFTVLPASGTTLIQPLAATCSGMAKDASINWSAQPSNGRAPYSYSWSIYGSAGDVTGSYNTRSQSASATYGISGTKQAAVRVTDSTGAAVTATCSQMVTIPGTSNVTPPTSPSTVLSISSSNVTVGSSVTLTSTTQSPSQTLKNAAIDQSTDNVNWISGAPCGYWSNTGSHNSQYTISCSFTPTAPGTYYFRSRGSDNSGVSSFVTRTLTVTAAPVTQTAVTPTYQACGGTQPSGAGVTLGGTGYYQTGYGTNQWTFVSGTPSACQWTCASGYGLSGNTCAAAGTTQSPSTSFFMPQACGGTEPTSNGYVTKGNGTYQTGYGTTRWTFVTSSPNACQYSCTNGGVYNGTGCAAPVSISTPTLSTTSWYANDPSTWPIVTEAAQLNSNQAMRVKGLTGDQYLSQQNGVSSARITSSPPAGTTQIELYVYDYSTGTKIANGAVNITVTNKP